MTEPTTPSESPAPTPEPPATPIVSWEAPKEEAGPAPGVHYASHGGRLLAYIIDALIIGFITIVLTLVAIVPAAANRDGSGAGAAAGLTGILLLLIFVLVIGYCPWSGCGADRRRA